MENTKKALAIWDGTKTYREHLWEIASSSEEVAAAIEFEQKEADKVREAFYQDTKEINNRSHANLIHPDDSWLRKLVTKTGV